MAKRPRPGAGLQINVGDSKVDESYDADAEIFEKGDLAIDSEGFSMGTGERERFPLVYDDLEIGDVIGQGSSSVVIRARYSRFRSGRDCVYVALKVRTRLFAAWPTEIGG